MSRLIGIIVATLFLLLGASACGDDDESTSPGDTMDAIGDAPIADADTTTTPDPGAEVSPETVSETMTDMTDAGPTTPVGHEFIPCEDIATPAGVIPAAFFEVDAGCYSVNPFEVVAEFLCPESKVLPDPVPVYAFSGQMVATDTTYARIAVITGTLSAWIDPTCVDTYGSGTCDGVETFVLTASPDAIVSCVDDAAFGGCVCEVTADANFVDAGTYTATDGGLDLSFVNNSGEVSSGTFAVSDEGAGRWKLKQVDDGALDVTTEVVARTEAPTLCETYCYHFMAGCQDLDVAGITTPYGDVADCLTQCDGLTATGEALPVLAGDSLECRLSHVKLAVDPADVANPATHCVHAQLDPTAPCMN